MTELAAGSTSSTTCPSSARRRPGRRPGAGAWRCRASSTPATPPRPRSTTCTSGSPGRVVATFEIDALYDYRARRPPITFREDHYEGYQAPRLVVRLMHDGDGAPYLLLHGPEPDIQWEAFAGAVRAVVEHFGVRLVVSLGSVPMAVPHTRPMMVTQHANRGDLMVADEHLARRPRGPGERSGAARAAAGGVGPPRDRVRRPRAALPRPVRLPGGVGQAARVASRWSPVSRWTCTDLESAAADQRARRSRRRWPTTPRSRRSWAAWSSSTTPSTSSDGEALPMAEERDLPTAEELGRGVRAVPGRPATDATEAT